MKTLTIRVPRTRNFCGYRSYRFNELVHAHYFKEGIYPPFAVMRDYFRRSTETTLRDFPRSCPPAYVLI